ncbi:MAG: fructoselysine 6-kinase, partial [Candidatus Bathyarchaeota archaeon]|nr:fructoselysine 6-kinase [Candidatus Bathyarchaeota archaeon]
MKLLAVGDNCVDNYTELGRRFPGGNALNVAVY